MPAPPSPTSTCCAALEDEGALKVRLYVMVRSEDNAALAERLASYRMTVQGNDFLTVRAIKRQIDGALGAHGAWLLAPYTDLPNSSGLVLEPLEEIEEAARIALQHGFQVNTHAIGDRANREVLDLYERIWSEAGVTGDDLRWRIEHAQHIAPEDIPRFGRLGVIAAVQGIHAISDGPWIPGRLGAERAERTSYRWRDLLDAGAILNNGTDAPVEPIDPIASIHASVSRRMHNGRTVLPRPSHDPHGGHQKLHPRQRLLGLRGPRQRLPHPRQVRRHRGALRRHSHR